MMVVMVMGLTAVMVMMMPVMATTVVVVVAMETKGESVQWELHLHMTGFVL